MIAGDVPVTIALLFCPLISMPCLLTAPLILSVISSPAMLIENFPDPSSHCATTSYGTSYAQSCTALAILPSRGNEALDWNYLKLGI